ncbi:MAG: helix-turn-helix domain-containing protein [Bacteroides sp.]|nr:helix-turn-helix domain-containing protein [Bacteroides sp.]
MEKVERIRMFHLLAHSGVPGLTCYRDYILILEMTPRHLWEFQMEKMPIRLEEYCVILVEKGEMHIHIDYIPYSIGENTFLLIKERNIIQIVSVSEDLQGYLMIVAPSFLRSLTLDVSSPRGINTTLLSPVTSLEQTEFRILCNDMERLRNNMGRTGHLFHARLVENELTNLILEIWNFRVPQADIQPTVAQKTGNRGHVVAQFFKLLFLHIRKQREVAFYADQLCVTPIYLSRAVKQVIGLPPIRIISDLVISDALIFLRQKDVSIQQIAEELHFPDQASFSKFFKKYTGKSPTEYRRTLIRK